MLGGFSYDAQDLALHDEAVAAGIYCYRWYLGGTPGITNLLARMASDQLDSIESMKVQLGCTDTPTSNAATVAPYLSVLFSMNLPGAPGLSGWPSVCAAAPLRGGRA